MNRRTTLTIFAATVLLAAACATPYEASRGALRQPVPPPQVSMDLPLENAGEGRPKFCQLGTTCRSMDPRPFAACLLSTRHCPGAGEPLLVTESPAPR